MEDPVSPFVTLICTVVPCLVMLGLIGAGIAFFVSRRNKKTPKPAVPPLAPVTTGSIPDPSPQFVNTPAPAASSRRASASSAPAAPTAPASPAAQVAPVMAVSEPVPFSDPQGMPLNGSLLAPSELVVLRAEAFAPSAGMLNSWKIIGSETKVSGPPLAKNMLAAAFLALERAGEIQLEVGKKKASLGLREVDAVYAVPTGQMKSWPEHSYEARIGPMAQRLQAKGSNHIQQMVYHLLEEDAGVVWDWAVRLAHRWMADRGVLDTTVKKGLLSSGLAVYTVPPETTAAAAAADVGAVRLLLEECQKSRTALWQLLMKEIEKGFGSRQESPDMD